MKEKSESFNPATGQSLGFTKLNSVDDLKLMVKSARTAQTIWQTIPINKRAKLVLKIRNYIVDNAEYISEIISCDNGKTKLESLSTEVLASAMSISYYCKKAKTFLNDKKLKSGNIFLFNKRSKIVKVPYGVVGIISPWNYPFAIPFSDVITGILSGNAVILKTASETLLVGRITSVQNAELKRPTSYKIIL